MRSERKTKQQARCSHFERISTRNFGLERLVCMKCGEMEMRNLPDETVVWADSLKMAAASRR